MLTLKRRDEAAAGVVQRDAEGEAALTRHAWANPVTKKALQRIASYINKDLPGFIDLFLRFDDRSKGHLLLNEVRQLLDHISQLQLTVKETINVLCHFHASDMFGNGWITLRDFVLGTGTRLLRVGRRHSPLSLPRRSASRRTPKVASSVRGRVSMMLKRAMGLSFPAAPVPSHQPGAQVHQGGAVRYGVCVARVAAAVCHVRRQAVPLGQQHVRDSTPSASL